MSYTKQTWANGDIITAAKLNHMEDGIAGVEADVSSLDTKLLASMPHDTASGSIANFPDGAAMPVRDLSVDIEPVQAGSGDPSPDNVRPISGWTDCKVTRTGKNLCYDTLNGLVSVGVVDSFYYNNNDCRSLVFQCKQGETYIASGGTFNRCSLGIFDALPTTGTKAKSVVNGTAGQPITANADGVGVLYVSNAPVDVSTAQIELGSTASAYEPYQGQTYTIDLDGTRYGGTLDVTTGKLTVDRAMVDLGTLSWTKRTTSGTHWRFTTQDVEDLAWCEGNSQVPKGMICSIYQAITPTQSYNGVMGISSHTTMTQLLACDETYSDAASFKTAMNGVQLVYELATPIEVDLTPTEITTLLGTNNIWADAGDTTVSYYADTTLFVNKKIAAAVAALS